jgi:RNase P subunit RPR2
MNCWHCQTELIWGSDSDAPLHEEYSMITFLSCPQCGCDVEVYQPKSKPPRASTL